MPDQEVDTERVSVRTYVPRYQLDEWDEHADELDMSRSEYLKTMVQAGRRGLLDERSDSEDTRDPSGNHPGSSGDEMPDVESEILNALSTTKYLSWDDLVAAATEDIEERLEQTLQELQAADRVRYSGPNGGYTIDE